MFRLPQFKFNTFFIIRDFDDKVNNEIYMNNNIIGESDG